MAVQWGGYPGGAIEATFEHPFYVEGKGWVAAAELAAGDLVVTADGGWREVEGVAFGVGPAWVHNLTVEEKHTFFVGEEGAWVHNCPKSASTKVVSLPETVSPRPLKPEAAVGRWDQFLGPGPHTNAHPRTGLPDADRLVSGDGTRSIRYGAHEMGGSPTKHHFHEETWPYDMATDTMTVGSEVVRVPLPKQ